MKYQQYDILKKTVFCLLLLFLGLMSVSVSNAEIYTPITIWGSPGTENGQFNYPSDIAVDSSDNVYVVDMAGNCVQKFALDPVLTIQQMTATIQNLVDSDKINSGQRNSLITKLNKAFAYLNAGDMNKATNEHNAFTNEIKPYVNNGVLSPSEGKALIAEANDVINAIIVFNATYYTY